MEANGQMRTATSSRLRREECCRTKHCSSFSNWKVLIGPSDWEDHSLGKDGAERYRTTNLPVNCSCPGLYELGIALTSSNEGRKTRQTALSNIIVVYLGQADNIRTRLQQYGRAGSHLEHGNSFTYWKNSEVPCDKRGPGLFKEIFSKNYSIVYRWAPMRDKKEAEKMEKKLLEFFDYAWNTSGNGTCRREDILSKLKKGMGRSNSSPFSEFDQQVRPLFGEKIGIKITPDLPTLQETESVNKRSFLPQVLKFVKSRPRLVQLDDGLYRQDVDICGVAVGNGHICKNKPVSGRKRCSDHKGKRITGIIPENESSVTSNKLPNPGRSPNHKPESPPIKVTSDLLEYDACGVVLGDGSLCKNRPVPGRKRCELHKGKRISRPKERHRCSSLDEYDICGVVSGDGSVCRNRPVAGSKSCELHQGPKIVEHKPFCSMESWPPTAMHGLVSNLDELNICGVGTIDGHACWRKPVPGRKRCEEHKGMRVTGRGLRTSIW